MDAQNTSPDIVIREHRRGSGFIFFTPINVKGEEWLCANHGHRRTQTPTDGSSYTGIRSFSVWLQEAQALKDKAISEGIEIRGPLPPTT